MDILAHEYADLFPMMGATDYAALVEGMRKTGFNKAHPIVLYQDKVLDGRNRLRAALELGIDPPVIQYDGSDPLEFVIQENLNRRQLSETQRAGVASRMANMTREDGAFIGGAIKNSIVPSANLQKAEKVSVTAAAQKMNVSPRLVQTFRAVEKAAPELVEKMERGEMTAHEASQLSKLDAPARARAIERVESGATVKQAARATAHEEKRAAPFPSGKYQVIYADPPWEYENTGLDYSAVSQYPTMPIGEICALPVEELTTPASVLFLWATNPLLPEALRVMSEWGFEYKTNIAWVKDSGRGMGWFLKSKHELLLIGVRAQTPQPAERPDSAIMFERGEVHSRKPEEFRELIERMYPGKKVELFARVARDGWDVWGNENAST